MKTHRYCSAEPIAKKRVLMGQTLNNSRWEKGEEQEMYKTVAYALRIVLRKARMRSKAGSKIRKN